MVHGLPLSRPRTGHVPLVVAVCTLLATLSLASPVAAQTGGECEDPPGDPGICLLDDRFKVTVEWEDFPGNPFDRQGGPDEGDGQGVVIDPVAPITPQDESGYYWFFSPDDVELVVKMVDARQTPNGNFWFFYGSLTNVEYWIRVVDTGTGTQMEYVNPPGQFSVGEDTESFPGSDPRAGRHSAAQSAPSSEAALDHRSVILPRGMLPSCGDPTVACVQGDRFAVEAVFDPTGPAPGDGSPIITTESSVLFGHLPGSGGETAVKVVDGREVNGSFWVFASAFALPDVEVRVTDLETGKARSYRAQEGENLVVADRQPFAPNPPAEPWMETSELPGFRFKTRITGGGEEIPTRQEADCVPETLCISGAVPGRSELFLRIVGPKPNGFLQPNVVKFSTSRIEVWAEQLSTGLVNYYLLEGASPGSSDLTGFFDRYGFGPD